MCVSILAPFPSCSGQSGPWDSMLIFESTSILSLLPARGWLRHLWLLGVGNSPPAVSAVGWVRCPCLCPSLSLRPLPPTCVIIQGTVATKIQLMASVSSGLVSTVTLQSRLAVQAGLGTLALTGIFWDVVGKLSCGHASSLRPGPLVCEECQPVSLVTSLLC